MYVPNPNSFKADNKAVEALLEGRSCFLGDVEWLSALSSGAKRSTVVSDLAQGLVSFFEHVVHVANLIKACTDLVTAQEATEDFAMRHIALVYRVDATRQALCRWFQTWIKSVPTKPTADSKRFAQTLGQGDMEVFISYQCFLILYNRVYTALDGDSGRELERESQQLSRSLAEVPNMGEFRIGGSGAVMCMVTSAAAIATADEWLAFTDEPSRGDSLRMISPDAYCRYLERCGIPLPT